MFNYTLSDETQVEYQHVMPLSELPEGERVFLELAGRAIVLFRLADRFYALGDVCTHDNGPLGDGQIEGGEIICPRHGARFRLEDGKASSLPAVVDIPAYPVRIDGPDIQIGIPKGK